MIALEYLHFSIMFKKVETFHAMSLPMCQNNVSVKCVQQVVIVLDKKEWKFLIVTLHNIKPNQTSRWRALLADWLSYRQTLQNKKKSTVIAHIILQTIKLIELKKVRKQNINNKLININKYNTIFETSLSLYVKSAEAVWLTLPSDISETLVKKCNQLKNRVWTKILLISDL